MTAAPAMRVVGRVRAAVATDRAAQVTFGLAVVASVVVMAVLGSNQWFIRDDWAFVITRNVIHETAGWQVWLFTSQDGHWMTLPILVYRALQLAFGLGSYWPFLIPTMLLHVAIVVMLRALCLRVGVSMWTTTIVCSLLLLFGNGWENVLFGIQITYNLSLAMFLAQLLLVDHDGPADRRDVAGVILGCIGLMSSAFGPFFAAGTFAVLAQRRRWRAAAIAVVPQAVVYTWWLFSWGDDPAGEQVQSTVGGALRFARLTFTATLTSMTGQVIFAGAALLGIIAVACWRKPSRWDHAMLSTLAVLPVPVFLAIGWQRSVFGLESAAASRYQYMAVMLLAVPFALAVDQLRRYSPTALAIGRGLLVVSILTNIRYFSDAGDEWAARSTNARTTFELVAGSPLRNEVDPSVTPVPFDPDVTVGRLPILVAEGAITPRPPTTPAEVALVRAALGLPPEP
ncbi:MAG: hypothetical protein WEB78_11110 [Ilumatobacteraceae bacterium]